MRNLVLHSYKLCFLVWFFFFNDTATTEIYTFPYTTLFRSIIMIGPGTGVAPFRAFLEERRAIDARGKNWLFFGDQHSSCDFLYRDELEAMRADATLTRLDTAFSRDQKG